MIENDIKIGDWIEIFTNTFRMLTPKDRDIYLRKLMEVVENAKKHT